MTPTHGTNLTSTHSMAKLIFTTLCLFLMIMITAAVGAPSGEASLPEAPGPARLINAQDPLREVVFLDGTVAGADKLRDAVRKEAHVVVLSPDQDAIVQIGEVLARHAPVDAVHIVSHGNDGMITLGGDWTLEAAAGSIETTVIIPPEEQQRYFGVLATFDGVGGSTAGSDYTESDNGDGVTLNITFNGDSALNVDGGGAGGSTGFTIEATNFTTTSVDVAFSTAVTLSSFVYFEADAFPATGNYNFTVTGGSGSPIVKTDADFENIAGVDGVTVSPVDWTNVTSFTITSDVGVGNFSPGLDTIVYAPPNATPVISIDNATLAYTEDDTAKQIDSAGTVSDADGDAEWDGGTLVVQITGNAEAADRISISDTDGDGVTITLSGTSINANGTNIGALSASGGIVTGGIALSTTFNADATNIVVREVLQSVRYSSVSGAPGTADRTVTFTVTDASGGSSSDTRTISVTAVNDDPAMTDLLTDIAVSEDTASNVDLSSATFSDVDSGASSVTLTLAAGTGTLTATSGGGVTVGGSGTFTLTLTGTAANIDTFLNTASNIKYTGASNVNGNDADSITLTANDGGNTGTGGGADVSLGTVNVDITAVNDNPAMSGLPTDITVTEETAGNVDLSAATLSDIDSGAGSITLTLAAGTGTVTATSGGSVTVGGSGTGTLTLTGTVSNIDTFLNTASNVRYTGAYNASGDNATTITVTANDGGNTGTGGGNVSLGTINVDITAVNDDPTMSGLPSDITVVEDTASNVDLSAASFADVDSGAGTVTLTMAVGFGTMTAGSGGGVTVGGSGTGTLTLTGTASNIDTFLNTASNIKYTGASNVNGNDVDTISLTANDGGNTGTGGGANVSLGTVNVDITAVNDPPVVGGVFGDNSSQVIAGAGARNVTDLDDATMENIDSPDYNGGFLAITQGSGTANGSWGLDGTTATSGGDATVAAGETVAVGGFSVGTVHATNDGQGGNNLQIAFNSTNATSARIQSLLRALTYSAPSGLGARTFTLTLNDADGTANSGDQDASGNFLITVTPNPPVVGNLDGDSASAANNAAVAIDAGGNATLTDADSPNFNGGNLTIARTGGLAGNFSLSGSGAAGVSAGNTLGTADGTIAAAEVVYVDGVEIGTIASDGQGTNGLVVTFNANATPARAQALIRALQYGSATGGNHTFGLTITDAGAIAATSAVSGFTVTINAAPVITGQAALTTFGPAPLTITLGDLVVSDADNSYPADFTLAVQDGANYSRSGTTITPDDGFAGDLAVPVTVNDGTDDSNTFNLSVYVATTRLVMSTADSGPGSLRQALADAGDTDVIDLSLLNGTIVLSSGPLVIDKDLAIFGAAESAVTISGNNAQRVLTVSAADVTLTDLTISDGVSGGAGGGIYNTGTLTLIRLTLSNNEAAAGDGGGIYNAGTLVATNTTVSGNLASGDGGGIANNGTATLTHCTIADNQAGNPSGGLHNSGSLNMANTLVADNTPSDCGDSGAIVSNVANLIADGGCSPAVSGDPNLGPLQDNLGSTFTHALAPGSPAIDAADAGTSESTDQRGEARPEDGDSDGTADADIGAFEYLPDNSGESGTAGGGSSGGGGCFIGTIFGFNR